MPYLLFLLVSSFWLVFRGKEAAFLAMNAWHHPMADFIMPWLTHLGDGLFAGVVVLVLLLVNYRVAFTAAVCFLAVLFVIQFSKFLIFDDALRPLAYFARLGVDIRLIEGVNVHSHNSFPSGHAASAFAVFSFLALQFKKRYFGTALLVLAIVVAYTRIYIAQHFFGDILVGSIIGVSLVLLVSAVVDSIMDRKPANWHQKSLFRIQKNR